MLISNLLFIFSKWVSFIFLWQIWFRNLKFFKFIEIWYIGRLVYAYFDFIFYFFKFFVIHIRSGKFAPKNWSSSNSLKCRAALHYYMLNMILMLILNSKRFVIHLVLVKYPPKAALPINWNLAFVYIIYIIR